MPKRCDIEEYLRQSRVRQVAPSIAGNLGTRLSRSAAKVFFYRFLRRPRLFRKSSLVSLTGFDRYNPQWSPRVARERFCRGPNDVRNEPSIDDKNTFGFVWIRHIETPLPHADRFHPKLFLLYSSLCHARTSPRTKVSYASSIYFRCANSCSGTAAACLRDFYG